MKYFIMGLLLSVLFSCQNLTKEDVAREITKDLGIALDVFCSEDMQKFRLEKIEQAKEKWPQFPLFDICPLLVDDKSDAK
jgi:hypothetical protein